jgi:hypothetical protein
MRPQLEEALDRIKEIRGHLATTETFRGYRAASAAATSLVAVATALVQLSVVGDPAAHPLRYVILWSSAAVLCGIITGAQVLYGYLRCRSRLQRAATRIAVGQLVPGIVAGAMLSWALGIRRPEAAVLLPGLWAVVFSLGIFASRRSLPRATGWVGLYYLLCGWLIFEFLPGPAALASWVMGVTFGLGQMATAIVLYWNLERNAKEEEL